MNPPIPTEPNTPIETVTSPKPVQTVDTSQLFQKDPEPLVSTPEKNLLKRLGKKKLLILAATLVAILVGGGLVFAQLSKSTDESVTHQPAEEKAKTVTQSEGSNIPADDTADETTNNNGTPPTSTPQTSTSNSGTADNTGSGASSTGSGSSSGSGSTTTSPKTYGISYTNSCFSPANLTIKKGDTVKFTNNSTKDMWPASDNHPSHTTYSEFDAKGSINPGGTYSFTFNKTGSWGYHDHLKPSCSGTITVQ